MARLAGIARERIDCDIVIVGAGPAGLAAALRLKQLARAAGTSLSVTVLEKGATVGAHILSGAVIEPRALDELLPDWRARAASLVTPVAAERFLYLSKRRALPVPRLLRPAALTNDGNLIVSLGALCRWLGDEALAAGVDVFPGFAADELLFAGQPGAERVVGVGVGDKGIGHNGRPRGGFAAGINVMAHYTLLAEGCRGHLGQRAIARFALARGAAPQTYGLGLKELWRVRPAAHRPGMVLHTMGWPLDRATHGGGFAYHLADGRVALGLVVALDYRDPLLSPFALLQRWKKHPILADLLAGGERLGYGARTLDEGGWQSLPRLDFPGGALLGAAAGTLNAAKLKGVHLALASGRLAAEAAFAALGGRAPAAGLAEYDRAFRASWAGAELRAARNVRPGFRCGRWAGMVHAALDQMLLGGQAPWTLPRGREDRATLTPRPAAATIRQDPESAASLAAALRLANLAHAPDQPDHLLLADPAWAVGHNLARYGGPEQYYCPAGVYEFVEREGAPRLRLNAANCLHCKACDIKDPSGNITWVPPEGGSGPSYTDM